MPNFQVSKNLRNIFSAYDNDNFDSVHETTGGYSNTSSML